MKVRRIISIAAMLAPTLAPATAAAQPSPQSCNAAHEKALSLREGGKLQATLAALSACTSADCPPAIQDECRALVEQTRAAIPSIAFDLRDAADNQLTNVSIAVDGAPVSSAAGAPIRLDPGTHTFRFSVEGEAPVEKQFVLSERDDRHERLVLGAASAAEAPAARENTPTSTPAARPDDVRAESTSGRATLGWVVGGVGVAGIALGSVFGLSAIAKNNSAKCDSDNVCADPQSRRDAQSAASLSTVAFAVGGVLAATGIVLVATAPKSSPRSARIEMAPFIGAALLGLAGKTSW